MKKILLSFLSFLFVLMAFSQSQFELQSVAITKAGSHEVINKVIPPLNPEAKFIDYDSLNMNYVGSWSLGPSNCIITSPTGDTLFIGSGAGVIILDVTDPYNPIKLSEVHARALVDYMHYSPEEGRLYLAAYFSGLEVWDVSDIQNPFRTGRIGTSGLSRGGVYARKPSPTEDTYAYLVTVADGIDVFSINDQGSPSFVGNQSYTSQWVTNSAGSGNSLFLAAGSGGTIAVDLSLPPPNMNSIFTVYGNVSSVAVNENQLNIVNSSSGIKIYDFTDLPATLLGELSIEGYPYRLALADNLVYVANSTTNPGGGIDIINVSDPSSPFLEGFYDSPQTHIAGNQNAIFATGGMGGCQILDVTDPENPQSASQYKIPGWVNDIAVHYDYAYTGSNGFRVFDVSDKTHPVQIGYNDTEGDLVKLYGNKAVYCPKNMSSGNKVNIMDISDPTNPIKLGHYSPPAMTYDLDVKGNYAFVACWWDGIRIIDFSNPENPLLAEHLMGWSNGAIPGEEFIYCQALDVDGNYLYAIDYGPFPEDDSKGLYIFDISDPANPELVKRLVDIEGTVHDIEVSNGYAYLADAMGGLVVVSVVDPLVPSQIAYLPLSDAARAIDVFSNYAFIANYINGGVQVIDISNPFFPEVAGYYKQTACFALNVTYDAGHAFVADGIAGMHIYNFDLLTGMESETEIIGSFEIAPNPACDIIRISSETGYKGNVNIAIIDLTGRTIAEKTINQNNSFLNETFDVRDLPRGVYLIEISFDNKSLCKKIILQ